MKKQPPQDNLGLVKTMLLAAFAGILLIGGGVGISKAKTAFKSASEKREIETRDRNMAEAR